MKKVLVCSAWDPEQTVLRERVIESSSGEQVNEISLEPEFLICGVGVFAALESVTRHLAGKSMDLLPDLICFVGTAGAERSCFAETVQLPFGDCVTEVLWHDHALAAGEGYVPGVMQREAALGGGNLRGKAFGFEALVSDKKCVSCYGISTQRNDFFKSECCYENLELYGVARAAARFGIAWCAFLGISNWIGTMAHQEWQTNHEAASACAQRLCYAALFGGGSSSN